jgi:hypothetical protein
MKVAPPARADAPGTDTPSRTTRQQRLETSPIGRAFLSGILLFTLAAMIVSNLPESELRRTASRVVNPWLDVTGLHQNWKLFAPDPRRVTLQFEARLTYADGSKAIWHPPVGDPFVGVYGSFRWRKWAESVLSNASLWGSTSSWLARTHTKDGRYPVRVALVRRFYQAPAPGRGTKQPPWGERILFTARFTPEGERA